MSIPRRNSTSSQDFREWRYMSEFYQNRMDALLEKAVDPIKNQHLLGTITDISKIFFENPWNFQWSSTQRETAGEFYPLLNDFFCCIQGESEEDYLNEEVYRDTPNEERMEIKLTQRQKLLEDAKKIVSKSIEILQSRQTFTSAQFQQLHQRQSLESIAIENAQAQARAQNQRFQQQTEQVQQAIAAQRDLLVQRIQANGLEYAHVQGTRFDLDFDLAMMAVRQNGQAFAFIHPRVLEEDFSFSLAFAAITQTAEAFDLLPRECQSNAYFLVRGFLSNPAILNHIDRRFQNDPRFFKRVMDRIQEDIEASEGFDQVNLSLDYFQKIHQLVLWSATSLTPQNILIVSTTLNQLLNHVDISVLNSLEFTRETLLIHASIFSTFYHKLRADRVMWDQILSLSPLFLIEYNQIYPLSTEKLAKLVCDQPRVLKYFLVRDRLKTLIKNTIDYIQESFNKPSNAFSVAITIVNHLQSILHYTPTCYLNDQNFAEELLLRLDQIVQSGVERWGKSDRRIQLLVQSCCNIVNFIPEVMFERQLSRNWIKRFGFLFYKMPEHLRSDQRFIELHAKAQPSIFLGVQEDLRKDPNFILHLLSKHISVVQYCAEEIRADRTFFLRAVRYDYRALEYADRQLRSDPEFILDVIKINPLAFKGAATILRHDQAFVERACRIDPSALFGAGRLVRDAIQAQQANPVSGQRRQRARRWFSRRSNSI